MVHRRGFLGRSVVMAGGWGLFSNTSAQVLNINDAINKSGRQRMLSPWRSSNGFSSTPRCARAET